MSSKFEATAFPDSLAERVRELARTRPDDPAYLVDGLVTHTYSLDEWQQGLTTASAGPKDQAVKVTLRPNADLPLL